MSVNSPQKLLRCFADRRQATQVKLEKNGFLARLLFQAPDCLRSFVLASRGHVDPCIALQKYLHEWNDSRHSTSSSEQVNISVANLDRLSAYSDIATYNMSITDCKLDTVKTKRACHNGHATIKIWDISRLEVASGEENSPKYD